MARSSATHALLLAENESCLAVDRIMLRRLGIRMQFFASGRKALDHLSLLANGGAPGDAKEPAMLICNERLADMTGMRFLSHVRSMPGMADIPVLFLVSNGENVIASAARASNSCAVLARPYTMDQAENALSFAAKPEARRAPLALPPSFIDRFGPRNAPLAHEAAPQAVRPQASRQTSRPPKAPPARPGETALREGLAALRRGDAVTADSLLRGSYQIDPDNSNTCLALSKLAVFRNQGKEGYRWLCKAGVLSLKHGDISRANAIFGRLPRGKVGQDPLLAEAGLVLQEGETRVAALSFLEAHRLDPSKPLHTLIGRTCLFTPTPEEYMRGLIQALAGAGHDATATRLEQRLLQAPKEEEERRDSFLENFPLLHDIVSVASYTFKTWRQAA